MSDRREFLKTIAAAAAVMPVRSVVGAQAQAAQKPASSTIPVDAHLHAAEGIITRTGFRTVVSRAERRPITKARQPQIRSPRSVGRFNGELHHWPRHDDDPERRRRGP
jgi:hypothetical protein